MWLSVAQEWRAHCLPLPPSVSASLSLSLSLSLCLSSSHAALTPHLQQPYPWTPALHLEASFLSLLPSFPFTAPSTRAPHSLTFQIPDSNDVHSSRWPPFLHPLLSASPQTPFLISHNSFTDKLPGASSVYEAMHAPHLCSPHLLRKSLFASTMRHDRVCAQNCASRFPRLSRLFQTLPAQPWSQPRSREEEVMGAMEGAWAWRQPPRGRSPALPHIN